MLLQDATNSNQAHEPAIKTTALTPKACASRFHDAKQAAFATTTNRSAAELWPSHQPQTNAPNRPALDHLAKDCHLRQSKTGVSEPAALRRGPISTPSKGDETPWLESLHLELLYGQAKFPTKPKVLQALLRLHRKTTKSRQQQENSVLQVPQSK